MIPGVIETLTSGFNVVNRVPWVLVLPVLIDLLLWLGPRLSVANLAERVFSNIAGLVGRLGQDPATAAGVQIEQLNQQLEWARAAAKVFNLLSLLAFNGLRVRSSAVPAELGGTGGNLELGAFSGLALAAIALALFGILLSVAWLGMLAQQVRDGRVDYTLLLLAAPRYWLAIVALIGLMMGGGIAVFVPLSLAAAIAQLFAPALAAFIGVFIAIGFQLALFWCLVYLYFFTSAVVTSEVGPLKAALNSIRVVSASFWSALGFIIITWVIMSGMGVIWHSLARAPAGQAVAILGNGYIESGLAAAAMLFYRDRLSRLTPPRAVEGTA